MIKSIEAPAEISYIAVRNAPRRIHREDRDWKSLYHAQAAEAKIMRVVFFIMAALVAFSEMTALIAVRIPG